MIEVSLWIPVVVVEILVIVAILVVVFARRERFRRQVLVRKIKKLETELAEGGGAQEAPPDEPEPQAEAEADPEPDAESDPEPDTPPRLVLLSNEDVEASTRPPADEEDGPTPQELCDKAIEGNQWLSDQLNSVLERSAALGMQLGAIKSREGLDEETKTQIQMAIDHMRETDEVLVEAADKGIELDETLRFVQSKTEAATAVDVDNVSLNEILMARAEGQTEDELTTLREEVRQRLLAPPAPPEVDPEVVERAEALDKEVSDLKAELEKEKSELEHTQAVLADVTEEYQRLFEQFQPTA